MIRTKPNRFREWLASGLLLVGVGLCPLRGDEPPEVFSGPQPGEMLSAFTARGVFDEQAGKTIDVLEQAAGKPLVLIFVHHPLTRPSAAVTRGVARYAAQHSEHVTHVIVWLHDDRSEAEAYLRRARSSLSLPGLILVSDDGAEGPGALGLNRDVSLTVLVARDKQIVGNFALVQPSTQDGPRIVEAIARASNTPAVTQDEFDALCHGGRAMRAEANVIPRQLLAPLINKSASEEEVSRAAAAIEEFIADSAPRRQELGRIAQTIVKSGKLANYGTPAAQQQLREWARKFGKEPVLENAKRPASSGNQSE